MNAALLLDVANRIENAPQDFDQSNGIVSCPACVAATALLVLGLPLDNHWPHNSVQAAAYLGLDLVQSAALFSPVPDAAALEHAFPTIPPGALDAIGELQRWAKVAKGVIKPAHPYPELPHPTFSEFWNWNHYHDDEEPGPDGEDPHHDDYVASRARVMVATLGLIARGPQD